MTSGGTETFGFDGRGLRTSYHPPPTDSDPDPWNHKTIYHYDALDRVEWVQDPRGHVTDFRYNARGQLREIIRPPDPVDGQRRSVLNVYNDNNGTLQSVTDELGHTTTYGYDDYKRVTSVTNARNETTTAGYAPWDGAGSYSHTTSSVYRVASHLQKTVHYDYDDNFRRTLTRQAPGTADEASTFYGYDDVGNLTSVQDPRGHITTFGYDNRNRRISATAPAPFNDQITQWAYDTRSNLTRETRPDLSFRRMEYDPLSRVIHTYGFANEHTHYERDLAGNVIQMIDAKNASYYFGYDAFNRKTSATYPADATPANRSESWHYDIAGNLDQYTNPALQVRTLTYDNRNRPWDSWWNSGLGPFISTRFDAASRLTSITTNNGETAVAFGYDEANRQIWEDQTVTGYPTRRVQTDRDGDGNRSILQVPGIYAVRYDYTQRNQLRTIYNGNWTPWFNYSYDAAGNMTKRQGVFDEVNDSTNILDSGGVSQYDALNRPMMGEQTGDGNAPFARSHFSYDNLGRLRGSWREEQQNKGEWFDYDTTGQLTGVRYNADGVSSGNPQNASRTVSYTMTPDTLNRSSMTDNAPPPGEPGGVSNYQPNGMNQYESAAGGSVYYDGNFNLMWTGGFSAWYDAANRLRSVSSGEDYGEFTYDGLGRCLKRTVNWETTLIAYDGWKPTVEWDQWNNLKAWNIYGPGPDEILYRHDAYLGDLRYHLDRMGNVVFLLYADGNGIERYTYDAFGHPTVTDWNGEKPRTWSYYGNRFMFTGREYFPELGLYDYRNRFYHPILGRFLQGDPIGFGGGDANLFRYCGGDPVNRTDPSGLDDKKRNKDQGGAAVTGSFGIGGVRPNTANPMDRRNWGDRSRGDGPGGGSARDWGITASDIASGGRGLGDAGGGGGYGPTGLGGGGPWGGFSLGSPLPSLPAAPTAYPYLPSPRPPDFYQLSIQVPVPHPRLLWFGAQLSVSVNSSNGHVFLGAGPSIGRPTNAGINVTANWVSNMTSVSPSADAVDNSIRGASINPGIIVGPYAGGASIPLQGGPIAIGFGFGVPETRNYGASATGTLQVIPFKFPWED